MSNDNVTFDPLDNQDIYNEKKRFEFLLELLDRIHKIPFQSDVGKQLQADMKTSYQEVIKPIIIERAKEFIQK